MNLEAQKIDGHRANSTANTHEPIISRRSVFFRGAVSGTRLITLLLGILFLYPMPAWSQQAGSPAPRFELADANGKKIALEDFRGKVLLLNFWAPWCASCRIELPALEALHRKYADAGLRIVGITEDTSEEGMRKAAQKSGLSYPLLIDREGKVADVFRVSGLPTTFIIDRTGVIRYRHAGFMDEFKFLYEKETAELLTQ